MDTDILIIGAGLAGLALARSLVEQGRDVRVLEARDRLGGRILTEVLTGSCDQSKPVSVPVDLGPAWFWPGQKRIEQLLQELNLTGFEQYADGHLVFQDGAGTIRRDINMAPMQGSMRIAGGLIQLCEGLAAGLPAQTVSLQHKVSALDYAEGVIKVTTDRNGRENMCSARQVVVALPPRLLAESIELKPALTPSVQAALQAIPTWMAGHAKVIAVFDTPFWRESGLSGDAISHCGPLAEIHDASPRDGSIGVLFGFAATPAAERASLPGEFQTAAARQISALFAAPDATAPEPQVVHVKDWAEDRLTSVLADTELPAGHPRYGTSEALLNLWDGRLHLGSTEMANEYGGFLEGALESAEMITDRLMLSSE